MKKVGLLVLLVSFALLSGCGTKNRSEEIKNYAYTEKSNPLSPALQEKFGSWLAEGVSCYGLVALVDAAGRPQKAQPIKAKVITIKGDSIKMKALEKVALTEVKGCNKLGLSKGDTWWEVEGDLYKTQEEALAYIKEKGWDK